jgi:hypothetical protein
MNKALLYQSGCRFRIAGVLVALLASQTLWAAPAALKIMVRAEGLVSVPASALQAAGLALEQVSPAKLALSCQGQPVSLRVRLDPAGKFGPGASLLFYGQPLNERWTDTNVYWLTWEGGTPERMAALPAATADQQPLPSFPHRLRLEQNKEYGYLIWVPETGELDPWFWGVVKPKGDLKVTFDLPGLLPAAGPVRLEIMVRGRTSNLKVNPDHHLLCNFKGKKIAEAWFDGQESHRLSAEIPAGELQPTGNTLTLSVPGDTEAKEVDQVFLDWIEITYPRGLQVSGGQFTVTPGQAGKLALSGLVGPTVDVYEVSNPRQPRVLAEVPVTGGKAEVGVGAPGEVLQVVAAEGYLPPAAVLPAGEPKLRQPAQGADYLVIAHDSLLPALEPLLQHRRQSGLRVAVAPVSSIYDEFNSGVVSPHALRAFVAHAYEHWPRPAPQYLLLVGDANYDPRDYLGTGVPDLLPAYPVRLLEGIETPCDHWYACVAGDDQSAELAVGRLPAANREQLAVMVQKILAYERQDVAQPWATKVLCVADHELQSDEPSWFEQSIERFWKGLQTLGLDPTAHYIRLTKISRNMTAEQNRERVRTTARPAILKDWQSGVAMVVFEGHGGATYWGRQQVLTTAEVAEMKQPILPVCLEITCFTGQFDKPDIPQAQCLAEAMLTAPGGAVATISPSRLGGIQFYGEFMSQVSRSKQRRLGPLLRLTRDRYRSNGVYWSHADTYNLLGDPALGLRLASAEAPAPADPVVETPAAGEPPATKPPWPAEKIPPRGKPGRMTGGALDHNENGIDDRIEKIVQGEKEIAGRREKIEVALLFPQPPTEATKSLIRRLGGEVMAQGKNPPALLISITPAKALELAGSLGPELRFMRLGATPPPTPPVRRK